MDSDVVNDSEFAASYRTRKWINGVLISTETTSSDGRSSRTESLGTTTSWEQSLPIDGAWTTISTTADGQKFVRTYTEVLPGILYRVLVGLKKLRKEDFPRPR